MSERKLKENLTDFGDCPKCGYKLIQNYGHARCAKETCGYHDTWENYRELFTRVATKGKGD